MENALVVFIALMKVTNSINSGFILNRFILPPLLYVYRKLRTKRLILPKITEKIS